MPWLFLNSAASQSTTALSKLSPPRWLSPAVDLTSKTPSPISSTDTSNVPPPRSKTRIVWSASLSRPQASHAAGGLLAEAVGPRRGGRLVYDALDVEPRDLAGVLRRLALVVVEVGGHGDDRCVDLVAQVRLGVGLQLLQDHRADLGRRVLLAAGLHARVAVRAANDRERDHRLLFLDLALLAAHEALDREHRVLGVRHGLPLGYRADEALAARGECDHRRGRARALCVLDDGGVAALEDRHARVRRAEVDAYRSTHSWVLLGIACLRNLSLSVADVFPGANRGGRGGEAVPTGRVWLRRWLSGS